MKERENTMVAQTEKNKNADIRARVQAELSRFSRVQRRIADAFLEDPVGFARGTLADISEATGASEPTIVRFCTRLGFSGYREFRQCAIEELDHGDDGNTMRETLLRARENGRLSMEQIRTLLRISAIDALETAFTANKDRTYDEVARTIASARRVAVFGIGGSSAVIAQEMHNRLFRLNIQCNAYSDSYMQRMAAATLDGKDVAFFISSTGRPRALLDSADLAKHYGAQCVGIAPADSPLGRLLDICIHISPDDQDVDDFQPSPLRYAQLFVIDSIAFRVASLIEDQANRALSRTRASVTALHGVLPNQPIGD
ncbi:MurR/RpiR family transcriptional regulator [Stakelama sediminis]|uniref:DNA-binding MurR/RpiR family transcriptional regulator n=1 Tax=Stakelama sediminis TaxID=463200 RepID=A0A840Z0A4_9SPHN|nr:MurR/RpiR family transcriptional regulator [Stakelama sediminis]MBB5719180.1 DNA-binding MurR/RpiR family transcriptional regulator [Stakelama sediminis]